MDTSLKRRLASLFREVNGDHPMTPADDAYVSAQFTVLEDLCAAHGRDADEVRRLMLERRLPLPGYLRSDGAEMVPADLFALADQAGGIERLEAWFTAHWDDPGAGRLEWDAYLSGQYVCLRSVTPASVQRKDYLTTAIGAAPAEPDAGSAQWRERLHALIDELDALEPAFTPYDRLRFGSPTSRDTYIDAMRARFPRPPSRVLPRKRVKADDREVQGHMGTWRKSTHSNAQGGSCVEVANTPGKVGVRDTKQAHQGDARTILSFAPDTWRAFLETVR